MNGPNRAFWIKTRHLENIDLETLCEGACFNKFFLSSIDSKAFRFVFKLKKLASLKKDTIVISLSLLILRIYIFNFKNYNNYFSNHKTIIKTTILNIKIYLFFKIYEQKLMINNNDFISHLEF